MKLIDTHTHINLRAFKDDAHDAINRAHEAGVAVINVGTQIDTSRQAVELLNQFPKDVYAVIGLHPTHTYAHGYEDDEEVQFKTREEHFDYDMYKQLAQHDRVVGIGECGLDYFRMPPGRDVNEIKQLQRDGFLAQIKLAQEFDKVLCIHCRPSEGMNDAYEDLLEIIHPLCHPERSEGSVLKDSSSATPNAKRLRFEVHCYTGNLETAQKFINLGGYIGINGIITFDKTGRSESVVKGLPLESIILETDAPYLAPKSRRGKRNEPAYLIEVAEKIAEWKNVSVDEVAAITTLNAKTLFKI
ncbi:MAG: TatD family hydrolase [bacterium]|nr:TatD family hydrolase [bacterium]